MLRMDGKVGSFASTGMRVLALLLYTSLCFSSARALHHSRRGSQANLSPSSATRADYLQDKTAFHFQPERFWMNGMSPDKLCKSLRVDVAHCVALVFADPNGTVSHVFRPLLSGISITVVAKSHYRKLQGLFISMVIITCFTNTTRTAQSGETSLGAMLSPGI